MKPGVGRFVDHFRKSVLDPLHLLSHHCRARNRSIIHLSASIDIHKFVILTIRQIQERIVADPRMTMRLHLASFCHTRLEIIRLLVRVVIFALHTVVLDLGRLAILDTLARLQLVEEHEVEELQDGAGGESDEDGEDRAQAGTVLRRVAGLEEERANDVACAGCGVVDRHSG